MNNTKAVKDKTSALKLMESQSPKSHKPFRKKITKPMTDSALMRYAANEVHKSLVKWARLRRSPSGNPQPEIDQKKLASAIASGKIPPKDLAQWIAAASLELDQLRRFARSFDTELPDVGFLCAALIELQAKPHPGGAPRKKLTKEWLVQDAAIYTKLFREKGRSPSDREFHRGMLTNRYGEIQSDSEGNYIISESAARKRRKEIENYLARIAIGEKLVSKYRKK